MKIITLILSSLLLFTAALAPAQETHAATNAEIQEFIAQGTAARVLALQSALRDAFNTPAFLKQLETALNAEESALKGNEAPSVCEIMVHELRMLGIGPRDIDGTALIARVSALLENEDRRLSKEEAEDLGERVMQTLEPKRKEQQRLKDQALLAANAERPDVTTLSNGVQMKVLPGEGKLSEANHRVEETGNLTCISRCSGSATSIPMAISAVANEIPTGSAWVFWIPAEVRQAYAAKEKEARAAEADTDDEDDEDDEDIDDDEDEDSMLKVIIWKGADDETLSERSDIEALLLGDREE